MDQTATETLNEHVTNMAAVESHILRAVEHQLASDDTAKYPDAVRVLTSLQGSLQSHVASLEGYNEGTEGGGIAEAVKEALTETLGVIAGLYDRVRQDAKVSRMIRDTYTATGLAAVSYHMLHTTALGLKDQRLADLSIRNLEDLTARIGELSEVVCSVVAAEMAAQGEIIDPGVAQQAIENTQKAWRAAGE